MFAGDNPSFEAGQFLLAALDQASDAVVIIDDQGLVVHFNAAAERMWGMPEAEILGRDAACLGIELSEHHDHEITIRRNDGSLARVHCRSRGLRSAAPSTRWCLFGT